MTRRTKSEQKAYLDGYEMCAECIEKYLSDEGKQKLECLLSAVRNAVEIEDISENKGEWIPIITRPMTEEEKEEYHGEYDPNQTQMYDCPIPEDGQEVLVTTWLGVVTTDTFYRDGGCYFETFCDDGEVVAWQHLPEPYKAEIEDKAAGV